MHFKRKSLVEKRRFLKNLTLKMLGLILKTKQLILSTDGSRRPEAIFRAVPTRPGHNPVSRKTDFELMPLICTQRKILNTRLLI